MSKSNTKNSIIRYLDETATPLEKKKLLEWLIKRPENRSYFLNVYNLWIATKVAGKNVDTEGALQRFLNRIEEYENKYNRRRKNRIVYFVVSAVATLALLVAISTYVHYQKPSQEHYTVVVEATQKKKIVLPDQSVVWLSPDSRLSYPSELDGAERHVSFEGDAFFEISSDKEKPFIIDLGEETIRVLGTSFNIQNKAEANNREVVLVSGSIELAFSDTQESYQLHPNEMISYSKTDRRPKIEAVEASLYSIKTKDRLIFDNESLSYVVRCLEIWYGVEIQDSQIDTDKIYVSFTVIDETPEQTMKMLSMVAPVKYEISGGVIHLRYSNR